MRVWSLPLGLLLGAGAACTGDETAPDTGEDSDLDGVADDSGEPYDPGPQGMLAGQLVDGAGAPLVDVVVTMCREVCKAERTDGDGAFVHAVAPGTWSMEVTIEPGTKDSTWSTPLAPVEILLDETRVLEAPLVVPELGPRVPLTAEGPVAVGDGLTLHADPSGWEAPMLDPDAAPWVAAVGLDPGAAGLPLEGLAGEALGLWYVAPTDSHLATPWGLEVGNTWDLAPGETVQAWVSDYSSQSWVSAGALQVSEDGSVLRSAGAEGLPVLGSVVLLR
jgi:hypothetical protein